MPPAERLTIRLITDIVHSMIVGAGAARNLQASYEDIPDTPIIVHENPWGITGTHVSIQWQATRADTGRQVSIYHLASFAGNPTLEEIVAAAQQVQDYYADRSNLRITALTPDDLHFLYIERGPSGDVID